MALPYLPHQEIPASFQWLKLQATTPVLHELVDYVSNQWVNTNTFPPSSWSVYGQPVRTNNDIEGWHNSLNRRAGGRVHLPFYLLIQLLHRESSVCTVQLRLVNARKLQRIQRKKYRELQARIFGYWEDYAGSKISSRRLLKACSHLAYMDQFEQIRFRSSPLLLVLYCYYNYSSFSVCFYRELKLAFEFVFKGRVSFGQPTRPRV